MSFTPIIAGAELEQRVQQIGRELLDEARRKHERAPGGWAMQQLMKNERLRVQSLRFVDVLPALEHDDEALVRHVDEYFAAGQVDAVLPLIGRFPRLLDWAMRRVRRGRGAHLAARMVRAGAHRMARNFIAGYDVQSASPVLERLHRQSMAFTLDLLGEACVSEKEADAYKQQYLNLLTDLTPAIAPWQENTLLEHVSGRRAPRFNLSVKLTALDSQMRALAPERSVEVVKRRLRPILHKARELGAFINIDMEQYDTKDITLRAFREVLMEQDLRDWPDVGVAMQAYLRDTEQDINALAQWAQQRRTPVTVRLVRGAYWDYETVIAEQNDWVSPVWLHKHETDVSYERCLLRLIEAHPHLEAAVATHNVRSLALALAATEASGLLPQQFEFQMLYGMAGVLKRVLVQRGQRLRVYVPFGELIPGMAYLVRRLLENTSSQSFLRMSFAEDVDAATLLAAPQQDEGTHEPSPDRPEHTIAPTSQHTHQNGAPMPQQADLPPYRPTAPLRFTEERERVGFRTALHAVRGEFGQTWPAIIENQRVNSGSTFDSFNPAQPDELIGRAHDTTLAQVDDALAAAQRAFKSWSRLDVGERAGYLLKAAARMLQRRAELAAWIVLEAGRPWTEADADVCEAIDFLEYYARQAIRLEQGAWMNVSGETNRYHYRAKGPGAIIAPWNFPLAILTGMTAGAIVMGNTAVVKPAPQTPVVAGKMMEIFMDAQVQLPAGVVNLLPGGDEVGKALVEDARTQFVSFTGSQAAGTWIYRTGAEVKPGQRHLKRIVSEMGGKNAIIIDSDADLDEAVRGVALSAFSYAGQKCSACSRVIVLESIHDVFVERLVEATRSLAVGAPEDPATIVGPVIDAEAHERLRQALQRGADEATCALGGEVSDSREGYFVQPSVFAQVDPDGYLGQEELFGPVLGVIAARDFDHALEIANGTPYALTGGVYSRSPSRLQQARESFDVGNLYLNRKITGSIVGRQPFGGFKLSGVGYKAGGPDYLLQFVDTRTVTEETLRRGFAPDEATALSI